MLISRTFYILSFLFFIAIASLNYSCIEEPVYLNSTHLKLVDTLVKNQIIPLQFELDSLCDLRFDEEVERAKDSIVTIRLEEINKKMRR